MAIATFRYGGLSAVSRSPQIARVLGISLLAIGAIAAPSLADGAFGGSWGRPGRAEIVLFDNGPLGTNPPLDVGDEMTAFTVAEDFEPYFAGPVTNASFGLADYGCTALSNWDQTLRWWIYDNTAGDLPGSLVATASAYDIGVSLVLDQCSSRGVAWYFVTFDLGVHPELLAGTRYWLALHMAADWVGSDGLGWGWTTPGFYQPGVADLGGDGGWSSTLNEHSFTLLFSTESPYIFVSDFENGDLSQWSMAIGSR